MRFGASVMSMVLISSSALAQNNDTTRQADHQKILLAGQLVEAMKTVGVLESAKPQWRKAFTDLLLPMNKTRSDEVISIVGQEVEQAWQFAIGNVVSNASVAYARRFSSDELQQLLAFYRSPLGVRLAEEEPKVAGELTMLLASQGPCSATLSIVRRFREAKLRTPSKILCN